MDEWVKINWSHIARLWIPWGQLVQKKKKPLQTGLFAFTVWLLSLFVFSTCEETESLSANGQVFYANEQHSPRLLPCTVFLRSRSDCLKITFLGIHHSVTCWTASSSKHQTLAVFSLDSLKLWEFKGTQAVSSVSLTLTSLLSGCKVC